MDTIPAPTPNPPSSEPTRQNASQIVPPPQTQSFTYTNPSAGDSFEPKKRSFPFKMLLVIAIAAFLLLGTTTVLFAYGVIPGDVKIQSEIADRLMILPFFPKTPLYVLKESALAQQKATKATIDLSFATSTTGSSPLGMNSLDAEVTGPIDVTDSQNPVYSLHAVVSKDFSLDMREKNHLIYFSIDKIPTFLSGMLISFGINDELQKEFVNKWFYIDTTPMQTEARSALQKQSSKAEIATLYDKVFSALTTPSIKQSLSMKDETLDGHPVYHIHFSPTDSALDTFWNTYTSDMQKSSVSKQLKLSDVIKNLVIDSWIDKKTYLSSKSTVTFSYKSSAMYPMSGSLSPLTSLGGSGEVAVSIAVKLSDYGKEVIVNTPTNAQRFDEFYKEFAMKAASQSSHTSPLSSNAQTFAQVNNTKRRSDVLLILNAVGQYAAEHKGRLPVMITITPREISSQGANLCSTLVPTYLASLPVDPSLPESQATLSNPCTRVYQTGYMINKSVDNRVTVSAPYAEQGLIISVTR